MIRTEVPPLSLAAAASQAVWEVDPEQSFDDLLTLKERIQHHTWQIQISRTLFLLFALLTTLLAAVGIFGVISYRVEQQSREIGIRMAIGSSRQQVVALVLKATVRLVAVGVGVGLLAAWVGTRIVDSLLFGVGALDLATYGMVAFVLAMVGLFAGWLPAMKASRIDPMDALRVD